MSWRGPTGYEVLRRNRVDRGRPMRLGLDYVRACDAFPGRVRLILVESAERTVAAALVYRVTAGHDLVQYWGDALHDLPVSPMNLLVAAVVEHALAGGASFVDIGISTEDGVPNHGLLQFKRSVGCILEPLSSCPRPSVRRLMGSREPFVVVGGGVAALVAADRVASTGTPVEIHVPERGLGGGFMPIQVGARRLDLGARLMSSATTRTGGAPVPPRLPPRAARAQALSAPHR